MAGRAAPAGLRSSPRIRSPAAWAASLPAQGGRPIIGGQLGPEAGPAPTRVAPTRWAQVLTLLAAEVDRLKSIHGLLDLAITEVGPVPVAPANPPNPPKPRCAAACRAGRCIWWRAPRR